MINELNNTLAWAWAAKPDLAARTDDPPDMVVMDKSG